MCLNICLSSLVDNETLQTFMQLETSQFLTMSSMSTTIVFSQPPIQNPVDELTKVIIDLLKTSTHVCIDQQIGQFPWRRPQPSVMAFHLVHCLRLLSWHQGWAWTNDVLIRSHLWPTLQQWNNKSESIREATVVCIIRLIGKLSDILLELQYCTHSFGSALHYVDFAEQLAYMYSPHLLFVPGTL